MARGTHWWNEPPLWAWVTMAVSLLAFIVLGVISANRGQPSPASPDRFAVELSTQSPSRPVDDDRLDVLIVGDSYTAGTGGNSVTWDELLGERLGWDVHTVAQGGTGYVGGDDRPVFGEQVADGLARTEPELVLFVGSRNDRYFPDQVEAAAGAAFATVEAEAPDAAVAAVGPIWDSTEPAPGVAEANRAVEAAAATAGVPFVDALAQNWLGDPSLIQDDGVHPNDDGQRVLADSIGEAIGSRSLDPNTASD